MGASELTRVARGRLLSDQHPGFRIIAERHGGASLIAALPNAHSDIEVGGDLHAQECLMGKALSGRGRDELHQCLNAVIAACKAKAPSSACRLRAWPYVRPKVRRAGWSHESAAGRWRCSLRCLQALRQRHGNNLRLRFGELHFELRSTRQRVSDLLRVPYQEAMLAGATDPRFSWQYQHGTRDTAKAAPTEHPRAYLESIRAEPDLGGYSGRQSPMTD